MKPHPSRRALWRTFLTAVLAATALTPDLRAADGTWINDGSSLWSTGGNWAGGIIADGSGFTANFNTINITADRTVSLDSDRTLTGLIFGDTDTATAAGWTLDNNGVSTNNLILAGATPTITVNTLGTGEVAAISAIIEGAAGLTKAGAGTLLLSGAAANAYTGSTVVSAGTLMLSKTAGVVAVTGNLLIIGDGATTPGFDIVQISGSGGNQISDPAIVTLNGTGADAGILRLTNQSETIGGLSSTGGAGIVENESGSVGGGLLVVGVTSGTQIYSGILRNGDGVGTDGTLFLQKNGTGAQELSGSASNTYTGQTTVTAGTLILNKTGAVAVGGDLNIGNNSGVDVVQLSGTGGDQIANTSILTIFGSGVNAGILRMSGQSETVGGLASSGSVGIVENGTSGTSTLAVNVNGTNRDFSGLLQDGAGGTLALTKTGTAVQSLSGSSPNTYTGLTTVSGGTLILGKTGAGTIAVSGNLVIGDGATTPGLDIVRLNPGGNQIIDTAIVTLNGTGADAGILRLANQSETIGGLSSTGGTGIVENESGSAGTSTLTVGVASGTQTYSGILRNGDGAGTDGTLALTKIGAGTQVLSGGSSYTGATLVSQGTLEVTANNALGTNAAGTSVTAGAALKLTGVNYTTAEALSLNGTGIANGGALVNSGTSTFAGQVTAATSASINAGGGTLNLTGGVVKNGTTLAIKGGGLVNITGTGISGASASSDLVVDGTTLVVSATSNYNGPTTVQNSGAFVANAAVTTTAVTVSSDSTLSGTGSIQNGAGLVTMNGALVVGDTTLGSPVASQFEIGGTGTVSLAATSALFLDLFSNAGDNILIAAASDRVKLSGALNATAGGALVVGNPNTLPAPGYLDQWKVFDLSGGGSITGALSIDISSLGALADPAWFASLDNSTGILSIVPEPSRALLLMFGLMGVLARRRV